MCFICPRCHISQPPSTPAIPITVEVKRVDYKNWNSEGEEIISHGSEIVKELRVCKICLKTLTPTPTTSISDQRLRVLQKRERNVRQIKWFEGEL